VSAIASAAAKRERFLIWGAGGHGKVVADLVRALGHDVVAWADREAGTGQTAAERDPSTVVITEARLLQTLDARSELPCGATLVALGIGDNSARVRCAERAGVSLASALVHPAAAVSPSARLGRGTVVFAGAVVNADAVIGDAVVVNSGAIVEHDCVVETGVHIAPGAVLTGGVAVGRGSLIGARAVVLPGVVVAAGALVGAGAVVARDVAADSVVAGVPARIIGQQET
jgi:sugar O-acyltransferase (sialic acid O-acetyltransferase NeuD family)